MNFKRKFLRQGDQLDPKSLQAQIVRDQLEILTKAVNDLFKLKVDKRIKRKRAA